MGNSNTKESRGGHHPGNTSHHASGAGPSLQADRPLSRRNRMSRSDLSGLLGISTSNNSGSHTETPYERRETRQEREARKAERERVARIKERERSLREEHVDGGYLVTLGTYVGAEDFNKPIVRQLQIERRLAPFWRGLNDIDSNWTEPQIIAAARGLPIPAADETPPEELIPRPVSAGHSGSGSRNLNSLTVPLGDRTQSTASDRSINLRGKTLSSVLGTSSRNNSSTDISPREVNLPHDPFVNGQPLEVFLYKAATECPICFLSYPPYLNHTRCCDQEICSECFVQIKRPDPHFPEGHNEDDPNNRPEEQAGLLVSEPACCPYCTQPDFGVTYEPPPFRRGLAHAGPLSASAAGMSSSSSLQSSSLSPLGSPGAIARRRAHSLSAQAPNVILTDRVRPEWANKLQSARSHQARRAAAATALHTAAFLMNTAEPSRGFRVSRFSRRNTSGTSTPPVPSAPSTMPGASSDLGGPAALLSGAGATSADADGTGGLGLSPGGQRGGARSRMEDLEEMMFMEAIRLSLAEEENRKRKDEKEHRKQAKKREKEDRKAQKAAAKHGSPYDVSGQSSASGSTLSLPGFGRKRGNSSASNLRVEASVASAVASSGSTHPGEGSSRDKGKTVDRTLPSTPEGVESVAGESSAAAEHGGIPTSTPRPIPSSLGPSHLRQMSSASSVTSSLPDSQPGSYQVPAAFQDPRASGLSLGGRSAASDDGGDHDRDPSTSTEPMFNYRSLAEVVGVTLEGENAGRRISRIEAEQEARERGEHNRDVKIDADDEIEVERIEHADENTDAIERSAATLRPAEDDGIASSLTPPTLTLTPDTPAPMDGSDASKQLGYGGAVARQPTVQ